MRPRHCARAHEEVGLAPKNVEVLGRLPILRDRYGVSHHPVVALVHLMWPSYFPIRRGGRSV